MEFEPLGINNRPDSAVVPPIKKVEAAPSSKREKKGQDQAETKDEKKEKKSERTPRPLPGGTIDLEG